MEVTLPPPACRCTKQEEPGCEEVELVAPSALKINMVAGEIMTSSQQTCLCPQNPCQNDKYCSSWHDNNYPSFQTQSLNSDPFNLRSEELAVGECTQGVEVRRMWSEQEMTCSFGGRLFPGTPDGMFESWDGTLTCVQVVRVPVTASMTSESIQETLEQTILTKVVKSQQWLRATHSMPKDFIIFCWLPFALDDAEVEHAERLMERVRQLDRRFSLRLRVPAEVGALFPARFASVTNRPCSSSRSNRSVVTETDVITFVSGDEESDEDDACGWDLTWSWDTLWAGEEVQKAGSNSDMPPTESDQETEATMSASELSVEDDDVDWDWSAAWEELWWSSASNLCAMSGVPTGKVAFDDGG